MPDEPKLTGKRKKPFKLGTVQTVDMKTGEVVETKRNAMTMLPPSNPNACQVCATEHSHEHPHNQQSIYYQMAFHATHARWPTWADAMAHCSPEIKEHWTTELTRRGIDIGTGSHR